MNGVMEAAADIRPKSGDGSSYLDAAFGIGARLLRSAVWHGNICNWFGPVFEEHAGSHQLACGTLGPGLYDGTAGIALFLGYLGRELADPAFKRVAHAAIGHALARAKDIPEGIKYGFYTGEVGIGYAAIEVGRCLEDPTLVTRLRACPHRRGSRSRWQCRHRRDVGECRRHPCVASSVRGQRGGLADGRCAQAR